MVATGIETAPRDPLRAALGWLLIALAVLLAIMITTGSTSPGGTAPPLR